MDRRQLILAGGAGFGGLTLPRLLEAEAPGEIRSGTARARSCIFIVLSGGVGQHETFDPKPLAPSEIRGLYGSIATRTPGMLLSDRLPLLAQLSDRFCLVRSMSQAEDRSVLREIPRLTGYRFHVRSAAGRGRALPNAVHSRNGELYSFLFSCCGARHARACFLPKA